MKNQIKTARRSEKKKLWEDEAAQRTENAERHKDLGDKSKIL